MSDRQGHSNGSLNAGLPQIHICDDTFNIQIVNQSFVNKNPDASGPSDSSTTMVLDVQAGEIPVTT